MGTIFGRSPALILALVQAAIALVISFGLNLTNVQVGAIVAFCAVVLGVLTQTQVTPTSSPVLAAGTAVTVPGGDTANPTATVQLQPTAGGPVSTAPKAR